MLGNFSYRNPKNLKIIKKQKKNKTFKALKRRYTKKKIQDESSLLSPYDKYYTWQQRSVQKYVMKLFIGFWNLEGF